MGLVMSHTYNLSHAYLSHTPHTVKHPTSVALLRATEWLDIETDQGFKLALARTPEASKI